MNENILSVDGTLYSIQTEGKSISEKQHNFKKVTPPKGKKGKKGKIGGRGKKEKNGKGGKKGGKRKKWKTNENILSINGKQYSIETEEKSVPEKQNNLEKSTPFMGKKGKRMVN